MKIEAWTPDVRDEEAGVPPEEDESDDIEI
jgi:hypothetical protein